MESKIAITEHEFEASDSAKSKDRAEALVSASRRAVQDENPVQVAESGQRGSQTLL